MTINDLLEQAKTEVKALFPSETFTLKDLFKGYEWKRIKQGEKSTLGILFLSFAQERKDISIVKKENGILYKKME